MKAIDYFFLRSDHGSEKSKLPLMRRTPQYSQSVTTVFPFRSPIGLICSTLWYLIDSFSLAHVSCSRSYAMMNLLLASSSATSFVATTTSFAFEPHISWISARLGRPSFTAKRLVRSRGCPTPVFPNHETIWAIWGRPEM